MLILLLVISDGAVCSLHRLLDVRFLVNVHKNELNGLVVLDALPNIAEVYQLSVAVDIGLLVLEL